MRRRRRIGEMCGTRITLRACWCPCRAAPVRDGGCRAEAEALTPQAIVGQYQNMQRNLQTMAQRISQIESQFSEHAFAAAAGRVTIKIF